VEVEVILHGEEELGRVAQDRYLGEKRHFDVKEHYSEQEQQDIGPALASNGIRSGHLSHPKGKRSMEEILHAPLMRYRQNTSNS
jgi:hypothetical protein